MEYHLFAIIDVTFDRPSKQRERHTNQMSCCVCRVCGNRLRPDFARLPDRLVYRRSQTRLVLAVDHQFIRCQSERFGNDRPTGVPDNQDQMFFESADFICDRHSAGSGHPGYRVCHHPQQTAMVLSYRCRGIRGKARQLLIRLLDVLTLGASIRSSFDTFRTNGQILAPPDHSGFDKLGSNNGLARKVFPESYFWRNPNAK